MPMVGSRPVVAPLVLHLNPENHYADGLTAGDELLWCPRCGGIVGSVRSRPAWLVWSPEVERAMSVGECSGLPTSKRHAAASTSSTRDR